MWMYPAPLTWTHMYEKLICKNFREKMKRLFLGLITRKSHIENFYRNHLNKPRLFVFREFSGSVSVGFLAIMEQDCFKFGKKNSIT